MTPRKPSKKLLRSLCGSVGPDDGQDPRFDSRGGRAKGDRKARQLCAQAAQAIQLALADSPGEDWLLGLIVARVDPAPDSSRLLVTVQAFDDRLRGDPSAVLDHLERATPRLRLAVASATTRRKAPSLAFRIALTPG